MYETMMLNPKAVIIKADSEEELSDFKSKRYQSAYLF